MSLFECEEGAKECVSSAAADSILPTWSLFAGVVIVLVAVGLLLAVAQGIIRFQWAYRAAKVLGVLFRLSFIGTVAVFPLAVLFTVAYFATTVSGSTYVGILKWGGIIIVGFLSLSGIGWVSERVWKKVKQQWIQQNEARDALELVQDE